MVTGLECADWLSPSSSLHPWSRDGAVLGGSSRESEEERKDAGGKTTKNLLVTNIRVNGMKVYK